METLLQMNFEKDKSIAPSRQFISTKLVSYGNASFIRLHFESPITVRTVIIFLFVLPKQIVKMFRVENIRITIIIITNDRIWRSPAGCDKAFIQIL